MIPLLPGGHERTGRSAIETSGNAKIVARTVMASPATPFKQDFPSCTTGNTPAGEPGPLHLPQRWSPTALHRNGTRRHRVSAACRSIVDVGGDKRRSAAWFAGCGDALLKMRVGKSDQTENSAVSAGSFTVKCPKCGAENTAPFKFCGECGTTLEMRTPH